MVMVMVSSSLQPARGSCCSRGVPEVVRKVGACEVHQQRHFVLEFFFCAAVSGLAKIWGAERLVLLARAEGVGRGFARCAGEYGYGYGSLYGCFGRTWPKSE